MKRILVHSILLLSLLVGGEVVYAQSFNSYSQATLKTDPTDPAPNSTVAVSISAYSVNTNGATIRWYVDGAEAEGNRNERSIELETGSFGEEMEVRAVLTLASGGTLTLEKSIVPGTVDLIVEADTSIPAFYKGRALPIGDEPVTVVAMPNVPGYGNPNTFTYTWKLGTKVLFGGPVHGKQRAQFTMPKSPAVLSVAVSDASGGRIGGKAIRLTPVSPEVHFYEENALRGLGTRALGDDFVLLGEETTVRAEPYYVAKDVFALNPRIEWTIDGSTVTSNEEDPRTISLRRQGGSGNAEVGFSLINTESLLQAVDNSFTIYFEG